MLAARRQSAAVRIQMARWVVLGVCWGQGHARQGAEGSSCAEERANFTLSSRRQALKVVGFGEENGAAHERLARLERFLDV